MKSFKKLLLFRIKYKLGIPHFKYVVKNTENGYLYAIGAMFIALILIASLMLPYFLILNFVYDATVSLGDTNIYITFVTSASQLLLFLSGLIFFFNSLFGGKENSFLSTLPFRKGYIFLTSFIMSYLVSYLTGLTVLLPGIIIFYIKSGIGVVFLIKGFVLSLLFPIVPMSISMIIILGIMNLANKFKHNELIATIFGFILLAVFIFSNMAFSSKMKEGYEASYIADLLSKFNLAKISDSIIPYAGFMNKFLVGNSSESIISLIILIVICILIFALTYLIGSSVYDKIIEKLSYSNKKNSKVELTKVKTRTPISAFCKKEIKLVLRSPIYALNCLVNVILGPVFVLSVFVFTKNSEEAEFINTLINEYRKNPAILTYVFITFVSLITAMDFAPSSTFSREGKNFWVTKIIPIPYTVQVKGRILASKIFYLLCAVPMAVFLQYYIKLPVIYLIVALIAIYTSVLEFTYLSIGIDARAPKLKWTNEAEPVKQNLNTIAAMLLSYILIAINLIPVLFIKLIPGYVCLIMSLIISIILVIALRYLLMTIVTKRYSKLYV